MDHSSSLPESGLSKIYTRLYTAILKSFIYDETVFENNATELTVGTVLNEHSAIVRRPDADLVEAEHCEEESKDISIPGSPIFREDEVLIYGMPERRQLSPAATKRLREEIDATLQTVAELFYASPTTLENVLDSCPPISKLPEDLERQVDDINSMQLELHTMSLRLTKLFSKTRTTREEFDRELEQLIHNTFPVFKASTDASIGLLSATLENTLQKLHSIQESAKQAFYNHQVEQNSTGNVSQAISIAYQALVEEEDALKTETQDLDRQIQEYEALLRLVDGSSGGYQQIVEDWVRIKRETDECLKDLRRLGWTGD